MSVTSTTNRKSYAGDAVTTSFATNPVVFFDSSDLAVSVVSAAGVETALTENTHYTVTGGDGSTGTVNLAGGSAPYGAPAAGVTLLILRQLPLTQPVDLVQNDGSDAEVQERAYDRLTMMVQQLNEVDARAIKLPPVETGSTALTELPFDRASKFLAFDADKNPIASAGAVEGTVPVSAFMATVLDDTTDADARTTLGALGATQEPGAPYVDTNPVVVGSVDATKKVRFEVDGLSTLTTRVVTVPDADLTLVGLATAQALSNKTIAAASNTLNLAPISNTLTGDVALNNTGTFFTGPIIAQGTSGTWLVVAHVMVQDTAGAAVFYGTINDGTTQFASGGITTAGASNVGIIALSAIVTAPAGDLRVQVKDVTSTSGKILFNGTGISKDSSIAAFRIA